MALDTKTFTPDATWAPTGDAAIVSNKVQLTAAASYSDDFEALNIDDPIPNWTLEAVGAPTFVVKSFDSQKVAQMSGAGWIGAYSNSNFGDGLFEVEVNAAGADRYALLMGRLDITQRSGYMAAYHSTAAFWAATSGCDPNTNVWTDYPWYGDSDQSAPKYNGATLGFPIILKHQITSLAGGEVEHFMFINGVLIGKHLDVAKKYPSGNKLKIACNVYATWGYFKFWPTKTGGFEKTFTPDSVSGANPWKRIIVNDNLDGSRSKLLSEYLEYRIDSGAWTAVPDDGDVSAAATGTSISVRANSSLKNDKDASKNISIDSIAIEIEGQWDAATAPDAPTSVAVAANGNTAATVTWVDASTGVYYRIYQNTANDFATASVVAFALQGEQTAQDTGLTPGQQYWFWVETVDSSDVVSLSPGGPATVTMGNLATITLGGDERVRIFNIDTVEVTRIFNIWRRKWE